MIAHLKRFLTKDQNGNHLPSVLADLPGEAVYIDASVAEDADALLILLFVDGSTLLHCVQRVCVSEPNFVVSVIDPERRRVSLTRPRQSVEVRLPGSLAPLQIL